MKATAQCGSATVQYTSLCAAFESNADHVLIEAWTKLGKPSGEMTVWLGATNQIIGKVKTSRIGVPFACESEWVRHKKSNGQR